MSSYFVLLLISVTSFALQTCLMAPYYRRFNPLAIAGYRGISLAVSMSPLLILSYDRLSNLSISILPLLILAATLAALGNALSGAAFRYCKVGVSSAVYGGSKVLFGVLIGLFFLKEKLSGPQIALLAILLVLITSFGFSKNGQNENFGSESWRGVMLSFLSGIFLAGAFSSVASLARSFDALIIGYFWEVLIGVLALAMSFLQAYLGRKPLPLLSVRDFKAVLYRSAPTVLGTGCLALALSRGPASIAIAVISTEMAFVSLMSAGLLGERLNLKQWLLIFGIMSGIVGLQIAG